ncbi:stomatin-like protein, putative [Trypanosoma brucei gambiense DAL972]|uniref:Stomatin-like protein, putative n=1 Tax=Trypanosoma brucei gambiense (strain MHOM/CI/86/DAL972) TaxID=679716 RepID=C9ZND8_TRYB9|nr:stomatin-like protein, putative [Trypanosoma brucei gambiense DAL972]CBH10916.1 stomatin-like protein, putative [Trypanosoma brucei gambiense DAL972]|eukprot:XP_011773203.1 stomatin-like protein, putative [Trypanosoma brucei gambiense DAL972]
MLRSLVHSCRTLSLPGTRVAPTCIVYTPPPTPPRGSAASFDCTAAGVRAISLVGSGLRRCGVSVSSGCGVSATSLGGTFRMYHSGSAGAGGYNYSQPPSPYGGATSNYMGGGYYAGSGDPNYSIDNNSNAVAVGSGGNAGGGAGGGGPVGSGRLPFVSRPFRSPVHPSSFIERVPRNTILNIVPQGRQYVVERLGRYHRTLDPGWWFVIPFVDKIRYAYSVKEQGIEIPNQSAITCDNVMVEIDGVLFLRIVDTCKASYNIENPIYNLLNLAQTTMRSEIGRLDLDTLFRERASLNKNIVEVLRSEAADWGIECKRYEIRDITVSELVRRSMDLQADAERRKRQLILQSEGEAQAGINRAGGLRRAQRLAARAQKYATVLRAEAEAAAMALKADAVGRSVGTVANAFNASPNPQSFRDAVALRVAEEYIEKFGELARRSNTVVLGGGGSGLPVSDPAAFTAQALSVFRAVSDSCGGNVGDAKVPAVGADPNIMNSSLGSGVGGTVDSNSVDNNSSSDSTSDDNNNNSSGFR